MELSEALRIFSEFRKDYDRGKARPRHSNTEELFEALVLLASMYAEANKDERDE